MENNEAISIFRHNLANKKHKYSYKYGFECDARKQWPKEMLCKSNHQICGSKLAKNSHKLLAKSLC